MWVSAWGAPAFSCFHHRIMEWVGKDLKILRILSLKARWACLSALVTRRNQPAPHLSNMVLASSRY